MPAAGQTSIESDAALAGRARAGDRDAFGALYERYSVGLYDFALRIVRDRELAADVVQTTFGKAWAACRAGREIRSVKAWLYTVARNAAIDELRARKPLDPVEDMSVFAQVDGSRLSDPQAALDDRELAELVWTSAAALSPEDYSLLHMHAVQDLSADELAEQLGLRKGAVYTRVSRLKDSLEESVAVTLLMRRGRRDCPGLDAILAGLGGGDTPTKQIRTVVTRHVRDCERCEERRRKLVSPVEILGALAPVQAGPGVLEEIWRRVSAGLDDAAEAPGGVRSLLRRRVLRRGLVIGVVAGLLAVAAASVIVLVSRGGGVRVEDPVDVHSTSHRIGVPSRNPVVVIAWSNPRDAVGYSVAWTRGSEGLPDETVDRTPGEAGARSPRLAPGRWWFNLRTQAENGRWTSTVHYGPLIVEAAAATAPAPAAERPLKPKSAAKAEPPPKRPAGKPQAVAPATAAGRGQPKAAVSQPKPKPPPSEPTQAPVPTQAPAPKAPATQGKPTSEPQPEPQPRPEPQAPSPAAPAPAPARATLTVRLGGNGTGSVSGGGIACGAACSATFVRGRVVTLEPISSEGSSFAGWSGACSGTGRCRLTLGSSTSVTATFDRLRHRLTIDLAGSGGGAVTSSPAGIDCGADCSASFVDGTVVTLTASAAADSTFAGWSGACSGTAGCSVTLRDAAAVTTTFDRRRYTLSVAIAGGGGGTVTSSPAGIDCGGACNATFDHGTIVTLIAIADDHSQFAGWGGACAGAAQCTVALTAPAAVLAQFVPGSR